ncbi:hypothetical protein [Nostoc favosum]|uniref:Uncharacterized protein n=1 Tax=Nostoc favosum CHAB5714 TaxID=2780399 RepID=A0ABS8IKJ6_9NOSO|nr:hypothetical protein [Nostoc favosum]MCC5604526.1 hypothetical protein [Nostoc favosum CHAB5714]
MATQIVENLELFSEAQLEALEFLPEELENIESELYPNLESISLEEVAKDLEAYFEGDVEEAGLEARGRGGGARGGRGGARGGARGGRGGSPSRSPSRSPSPPPLSINDVDYGEIRHGGSGPGPRSIRISRKRRANDLTTYSISPNPHNNRAYNNDRQARFYRAAANAIVAAFNNPDGTYPQQVEFGWEKENYTLNKQ